MPTILLILGWRFFFYANERNEPIHIHCRKAESEAKYWLDVENFQTIEAHSYNMSQSDKRTVRRIIFEHFDYIVDEWRKFQENKNE
jgi:Tat protein secretion system quality control protein TatD with DNase activity